MFSSHFFYLLLPLFQLIAARTGCEPDDICDFELQACDTQPSTIAGAMNEFIFSGRLDNLCMSFCSLKVRTHKLFKLCWSVMPICQYIQFKICKHAGVECEYLTDTNFSFFGSLP